MLVVLALLVVSAFGHGASAAAPQPNRPRVAVLVLENRSYGQVIGSPKAPYLNSLARRGALETQYYAVTHPSLPNYLALTTGGYAEITGNCAHCDSSARSLVNQLDDHRISWRGYFEAIPKTVTAPYTRGAPYNRHYNPFVYTDSLQAADLNADVTNWGRLHRDLVGRTLPTFSWIAPSTPHDGHNHPLPVADSFARRLVPKIERALGPRGVLFVTWDEGRRADRRGAFGRGGGRVALIALGPGAKRGVNVTTRANHYALLRTIEHRLGLGALGHAKHAPLLTGLLAP
jgi:arylsulfatase A-like enzyme